MTPQDLIARIPDLAVDAICLAREGDDRVWRIVWANGAFDRMFAAAPGQAGGCDVSGLVHWDYAADFQSAVAGNRAPGVAGVSQDTLCLRFDRSSFWASVSLVEMSPDVSPGRERVLFFHDIDDMKNREQAAELALLEREHLLIEVEAARTRLAGAIDMIPDPFAIYDSRDRLVLWNPAFAAQETDDPDWLTVGRTVEEIVGRAVDRGRIADAAGRERAWLAEYLRAWREKDTAELVLKVNGRDFKFLRSNARNGDRVVLRVDVTELLSQQRRLARYAERLEEANREISQQALQDDLTGLGNRRYLGQMLDALIAERERTGGEIAALHIDLDRFKQINDTMGHAAGDHVLKTVADALRGCLRRSDIVARTGGDEFVVLMKCGPPARREPERLADRLIAAISRPIRFEGRPCLLSASIGIARTPVIAAAELITSSDIALYRAKADGRATHAVFELADLQRLRAEKELSDGIVQGLERGEFRPVYQPQVDARTGAVVAIECLARWAHPRRGMLESAAFLPAAAGMHLDGRIDRMIFEAALAECRDVFLGREAPPALSFKVSLSRLMDPGLLPALKSLRYRGPVTFELVETIVFDEEPAAVFDRLEALRGLGVSFEIDDFGSGHASILGLRRIAPERLKIDRRLVRPIAASESAGRLVRSIVEIGNALGVGVTADGVETAEQARLLAAWGCDRLQGPAFGQPGPLDGILDRRTAAAG